MRSGLLNKKVELWRKTVSQSSSGAMTEDWKVLKELKSYTFRKSGRATVINDEAIDINKIRIQVRNQHDIREQDRIKYNGVMYEIYFLQPVDVVERFLMIHCTRLNE